MCFCIRGRLSVIGFDVSDGSLQCLNSGLFVHRNDQGVFGRIQVHPNHISGFYRKFRVGGDTPTPLPLQSYSFPTQNTPDGIIRGPQAFSKPPVPIGLSARWWFLKNLENLIEKFFVILSWFTRTRLIAQSFNSLSRKSFSPNKHCIGAHTQVFSYCFHWLTFKASENHFRIQ